MINYSEQSIPKHTPNTHTHKHTHTLTQVHTGLLLPCDIEIAIAAAVNRRSGLFTMKVSISIPKIRCICDPRQIEGMHSNFCCYLYLYLYLLFSLSLSLFVLLCLITLPLILPHLLPLSTTAQSSSTRSLILN
jgi:hypothetical protein